MQPSPRQARGSLNNAGKTRRKAAAQKQRRSKYIARACQDCQRRKVKCSGDDICLHCRARDMPCIYLPKPSDDERSRVREAAQPNLSEEIADGDEQVGVRASYNRSRDGPMEQHPTLQEAVMRISVERPGSLRYESPNAGQNKGTTFPSTSQSTVDLPQSVGEDTDTFNIGTAAYKNLSLSSQLGALRELLRMKGPVSPTPVPLQTQVEGRVFSLELPRPSKLRYLLKIYFRDLDSFFPYLDQGDTEARIFHALEDMGYSEYDLIVDVDSQRDCLMALLCNMLAMGECMDPEEVSGSVRPGWLIYSRGRKLLQHSLLQKKGNLDLLRYHVLSTLYMMQVELLQPASHAISITIQLAMAARLNDQSTWVDCRAEEIGSRQKLWWTIYYLDRRISQRSGTPYLIRDHEVAVEDFSQNEAGIDRRPLAAGAGSWTEHALGPPDDYSYLQVLINFSKLWGEIWDIFFAASAPKESDWREIEIADTRILLIRRQLPSNLTWDTDNLDKYIAEREAEPQIRRRLAIFIRINLLRMIIRQNPLVSYPSDQKATQQLCALISSHSIEAISAFANACPGMRPAGYFISTALVECIYHLVYVLRDPNLQLDRSGALEAFRIAYELLLRFTETVNSAKNAIMALKLAIFSGGSENPFSSVISKAGNVIDRDIGSGDSSHDHRNTNSHHKDASNVSTSLPHVTNAAPISLMVPAMQPTGRDLQQEVGFEQLQHFAPSKFMQDLANRYGDEIDLS